MRHSSAVLEACAQLRTYADFFEDSKNRNRFRERYKQEKLDAFRPRLFLLLGRRGTLSPTERRRADAALGDRIQLKTYDDILDRVKHRLSRMQKSHQGAFLLLSSRESMLRQAYDRHRANTWILPAWPYAR